MLFKKAKSRRSGKNRFRRMFLEDLEDRRMLAVIHPFDLATLDGSNGFRLDGIDAQDLSGYSVSSAGDVNRDGFDDILVGAPGSDGSVGETYVVFGSGSPFAANLDPSTLDGSNGFRMDGIDNDDSSGFSVSTAGDVNGDGYTDILVGAYRADQNVGETYVVFGTGSGFAASLNLSTLNGSNGFRLDGIDGDDNSGISVSTAGDVNGDGYADILVGAYGAGPGGNFAGEMYVLFGSGSGFAASLDLSTLDGSNGFRLDGIDASDRVGYSVSTAGDVNGDGYADILVGAYAADPGGDSRAGETYVVFGSGSGFAASLDLSTLNGNNGFRLDGIDVDDRSGYSVSTAGDVNGDGYADILVGAYAADPGGDSEAGETYVVFGRGSGFAASLDLSTLNGNNGFRLEGINELDYSGWSVSTAGDVNGDGFDDILVGAYGADQGGDSNAGESYVVFGSGSGFASSLDLSTLDGSNGFRLDGIDAGDNSGYSGSTAGDVNGDGYADILVGAYGAASAAGETYVVFGGDFTESVTHAGTTADDALTGDGSANVMVAGQGDDILDGKGGADVLYGAEGDDVIRISDMAFARIDGGHGFDTLALDGSGLTLDLTAIADNKLRGIEQIDITGSGDNTLILNQLEVLNLSDTSNTLVIMRDMGDTLEIGSGWALNAYEMIGDSLYEVFTQGLLDLGDAPAPYPTTLAEDGARHVAIGPTLGTQRDAEPDGIHSAAATADDTTGSPDDEDGVTFGTIMVGQLDATATVNVQNAAAGAKLDAWIDFNGDGNWGGPFDQIADSVVVVNGDNTISFDVPSYRLSTAGDLGIGGAADNGEVEDYQVTVVSPVATSGKFGGQNIIVSAARIPNSVFAADVDGDGDMDVLGAFQEDDKIAWYENDGSQNFTERIISTNADGAESVFAIDVDGDGDIDVLSASRNDAKIAWYENDGSQNFTERIISISANHAIDVDGDGDIDVLSASANDNKIAWYENDGSQNFTEHIISTDAHGAEDVFAIDLDGDGDIDVLSTSNSDDKIAWYENDGSQNFTERIISTAADSPENLFAIDVDGDGDIDVAMTTRSPGTRTTAARTSRSVSSARTPMAPSTYLQSTSTVTATSTSSLRLTLTTRSPGTRTTVARTSPNASSALPRIIPTKCFRRTLTATAIWTSSQRFTMAER